ncbi:MAG: helix-turn-helix transcriptional regulator [Planctomycetes bacterium]|nr:helix-turn-helix transcriptional regulator [Planctomycetota bacterium]
MSDRDFFVGAGAIHKAWDGRQMDDRDYPDYALVLLTGGGGYYQDARGRQLLAAGQVIVVFPGLLHHYGAVPDSEWREIWLAFRGPLFAGLERTGLMDRRRPVLDPGPAPAISEAFRGLLRDFERPAGMSQALFVARVHLLIAELDDRCAHRAIAAAPSWLAAACARLEDRLDQPLDPALLARDLGVAYGAFRKGFARALGVPPARYRQLRRIDRAKSLLAEPGSTLATVAARLGYCDVYFFSRQFRQVTGRTPGAWRRMHGGA